MLSNLLIPTGRADTGLQVVTQAPADAGRPPLIWSVVQVVPVVLIAWEHTRDTVDADDSGRQWERNLVVPAGHSPGGLVCCLMFVSILLVWEHINMCVACKPLIYPMLTAVPVAKVMY